MSLMNPPIDASLDYIYTVTLYVTTYDIDSENNDSCVRKLLWNDGNVLVSHDISINIP